MLQAEKLKYILFGAAVGSLVFFRKSMRWIATAAFGYLLVREFDGIKTLDRM